MDITSDSIVEFIKSVLSDEKVNTESSIIIKVSPSMSFSLLKEKLTECTRDSFIQAFKDIPRIGGSLSYQQLVGHSSVTMTVPEALAVVAIGKALNVWRIFPYDFASDTVCDKLFTLDTYDILPTVVGFDKGVYYG